MFISYLSHIKIFKLYLYIEDDWVSHGKQLSNVIKMSVLSSDFAQGFTCMSEWDYRVKCQSQCQAYFYTTVFYGIYWKMCILFNNVCTHVNVL